LLVTSIGDDPRWEDRLTAASKTALRWAGATALTRPDSDGADALDLLVGIMLADLRDSPPRQLFEHFDILPGVILARDGVAAPRPEALLAAVRRVIRDEMPPNYSDLDGILSHTWLMSSPDPEGLISLQMLFGALLATPNSASSAIRDRLAYRDADIDAVLASYPDFLARGGSYAEFLNRRHPFRPPAVQLPAYHPDQPRERRQPRDPLADPQDLVGIRAEVDAFAYLIASRRLTPPLAVGLFGDWGGGKSYFLRSIQRRVDELIGGGVASATRPSADLPFYSSIVQVEYDAWQYVEGDLWSSLLEHLFRNLGPVGDQSDDLLAQRQRRVIEQLRETGDAHDAARLERSQLEDELRVAAAEVERRTREREVKLAELERQRREQQPQVEISQELQAMVSEVVQRAGLGTVASEAEGLEAELRQAGDTLRSAGPVLAPLRTGGWRYLTALLVLLMLTPAVALVLDRLNFSAIAAAAGGLATLLATAAGYVRLGSGLLAKRLQEIAAAQRKLDEELTAGRQALDAGLAQAREELAEVDTQLQDATNKERTLAAQAAALEVQLAETTPSRVLGEFISERLGSDDYRGRLGVPALVRRDLARLSLLIQQRHTADRASDDQGIDRIVLYIDDLDRCPTRLVVDVLQAVHLLLAFPLFVVVVAVDARWVARSLRDQYRQLEGPDASPEDFIEKIFQVPFWVRPLDPETRQTMIRGLITPSLATDAAAGASSESGDPAIGVTEADLPEFTNLVTSFGDTTGEDPPWLDAAALTVSQDELRWMEKAAPLLGNTPRAVKRFANVYLLLRSMGRGRGWASRPHGQLVVLLAIGTNLPHLADAVFKAVEAAANEPLTLAEAVPPESMDNREEREQLRRWLDGDAAVKTLDLTGMAGWIELIRRFRFGPTTVAVAGVEHPSVPPGP
jgi:KAP family P-loop domain